ncbi:hypothetical protein ACX80V_08450 [Arthrobacter sp. MDT3-24]
MSRSHAEIPEATVRPDVDTTALVVTSHEPEETQTARRLIVPFILWAEKLSLRELDDEILWLTDAVRDGKPVGHSLGAGHSNSLIMRSLAWMVRQRSSTTPRWRF